MQRTQSSRLRRKPVLRRTSFTSASNVGAMAGIGWWVGCASHSSCSAQAKPRRMAELKQRYLASEPNRRREGLYQSDNGALGATGL
jgi:hypothetical protein